MDLSIVIPLYNEEESLPELSQWIDRVCQDRYNYEVILVDDGSKDESWEIITRLSNQNAHYRGIRFQRNYGKSAALNTGFSHAQGQVVITMDADLQDSPDEIPALYDMIRKDRFDLVSGWKKKRYDPISKTIPTKLYNAVTRWMSGIKLHDMNCGLKAYDQKVVKSIEVYGEMHRYIPVLAKQAGFNHIGEKVVQHQARKYGTTKFGLERFIRGPLDLLSVLFITKFGKRPMHFFGLLGGLAFIAGAILALVIISQKAYYLYLANEPAPLVVRNPLFFIGLVAMIIGVQLFTAGFIGELISRSASDRNVYLIDEKKGFQEISSVTE